jgi:hypothetical protein
VTAPGNQTPSLRAAAGVSRVISLAGRRGRNTAAVASRVESSCEAWAACITPLGALDRDLRLLDTRARLVAFPEKTLVTG